MGGGFSGDGGLLLTSFKVDNISMGDTANVDGGAVSTGLGWTLIKEMKERSTAAVRGLKMGGSGLPEV